MRAKAVGAGLLVFAMGALVGWAIASVVDDSASSDEVATIADDVGALSATVAALEDEVADASGGVAALDDHVATAAGRLAALEAGVRSLLSGDQDLPDVEPFGPAVLSLTCGSEPDTRIVEGFLVDADPGQVPVLSVSDADGTLVPVEIGDEVPVGAEFSWNLRDETSPVPVVDVTDRCGNVEPAPPPPVSVTLGCGDEPGSLVIEAFEPDIDPVQTALLYSSEVGGRLDQLEIGDVVPPDGELQWSILGIARGPWPVDEVVDTCAG